MSFLDREREALLRTNTTLLQSLCAALLEVRHQLNEVDKNYFHLQRNERQTLLMLSLRKTLRTEEAKLENHIAEMEVQQIRLCLTEQETLYV